MCGICGFLHKKIVSESVIREMIDSIKYRGPDDSGVFLCNVSELFQLGLAHRRLSILDLSDLGHQPMFNENKKIVVVFNGEIYNFEEIKKELEKKGHNFYSNSDTEVLLKSYIEWGMDCLSRFNGMFAFALWDDYKKTLFLARDRLGVKPLYYSNSDDEIIFASELKPIMKYPYFNKEINTNSLGEYLGRGYISGSNTIFTKAKKLLPGHYISFSEGKLNDICYWSLYDKYLNRKQFTGNYSAAVEELKYLLTDSIRLRMISDVPLGAFLSGGFDSTLTTALMQNQSNSCVKTFTIGFNEKNYDESMYAKQVASVLQTEHNCKFLYLDDAKSIIDNIVDIYDEPMADNSQLATMLLCKMTSEKVKVVLSGDGADELFGGYESYLWPYKYKKYQRLSAILNVLDKNKNFRGYLPRKFNKLFYLNNNENIYKNNFYTFWDQNKGLLSSSPDDSYYEKYLYQKVNVPEKYMLTDIATYIPDDILVKVDRASMGCSIEARTPFLDYRVVEFSLSLPTDYKIKKLNGKRIIKDLTYKYVSKDIMDRKKQGFGIPVNKWMFEEFEKLTSDCFDENFIKKQGIFDYKKLKNIINRFRIGHDFSLGNDLWKLLLFQKWYKKYM